MEIRQKEYVAEIKSKYEFADFQAWKNGEYIISAIAVALSPKKAKYPKHPHSLDGDNDTQQNITVQAQRFEDWANAWNKGFEQKYGIGTE